MDDNRRQFLRTDFRQGFPAFCGIDVVQVEAGLFVTCLPVQPHHCQQDGLVHAGVMATMADHTAGYATYTLVDSGARVLTIEFKINYLKPAAGDLITCSSRVISRGKKIMVAESDLHAAGDGREKIVAKAMVTLMVLPAAHFSC
ncbi:MAG: PaaI family thioesterase [Deltaproteobacteria bacterium]|nr:PaaI family thioesterase [Candidatus Anaeroferrophillus wilburensis]MBN2889570.1 PaaI family thioesterase [Deltaproteobacteria bacterium]